MSIINYISCDVFTKFPQWDPGRFFTYPGYQECGLKFDTAINRW